MTHDDRNSKAEKSYLSFIGKAAAPISRMGIGPTALTATGLVLAVVAGCFLWTGHLVIGGIFLFVGGFADSLDGAVARNSGKATRFGALLDSTFDRYAEFAVFLGFYGYLGLSRARLVGVFQVVAIIALIGSVMVSYVRARSEGLSIKCDVGFWQRPERIIALGTAAILTGLLNPLFIKLSYDYLHDAILKLVLIILAVGTNATAIKRLVHSRNILREKGLA
ncbi:CDP-alcohol phosphatidyltransferase family protein [bacterium]|nr:CDP-alcohol phosphatidyltransferase family protein [bacterium]